MSTGAGRGGSLSAQGTRLNRRGRETRRHLLEVALRCLEAGPEAASANLVAREAGATWGTVQHQFGDVDALGAAVLAFAREERACSRSTSRPRPTWPAGSTRWSTCSGVP
jgi:AcrR family transcriptional regulator